ncbi:hypothetical protein IGS74_02235 [Aureimonas sp. OT7]|uniref:hypothetical protein n=1 Tax=Aureimonas sp. OT7 TaxID=2816454 RepID=UPI001782F7B3|nr:hypothetical protein [Aureimonas sp. OT7]QOG07121.1 hypothetical protein IGS74_02235 [Aureimonas sp. OT7]
MIAFLTNPEENSRPHSLAVFCFIIVAIIFAVGNIAPLTFHMPSVGLDPSWMIALSNQFAHHARAGVDIVFTGGPFSEAYTRQFTNNYALMSGARAWCCIYIIFSLYVLLPNKKIVFSIFLLLLITTFLFIIDTLYFIIPVCLYMVSVARHRRSIYLANILIGTTLSAFLVLAKFSVFPILVLACLACDIAAVARRQVPIYTVFSFIMIFILFYLAGQDPFDLGRYLSSSAQVSAGYSEAMSIAGPPMELAAWLLTAALLATSWLVMAIRDEGQYKLEPLLFALVIAGFLFLSFKAGFVRHDGHSLIAWSALALTSYLVWCTANVTDRLTFNAKISVAVILAALAGNIFAGEYHLRQRYDPVRAALKTYEQIEDTWRLMTAPQQWRDSQIEQYDSALNRIQEAYPIDGITGTVDTISSIQSAVIAAGLDYRPRPTIQEYTSYTRELIAKNIAFLNGDKPPSYLILGQLEPIDGRHPASIEGSLWPDILRLYAVDRINDEFVAFKRREYSLPTVMAPFEEHRSSFINTPIDLPYVSGPIFMRLDIQRTLFGRLLNFAFRPPAIQLLVRYADQTSETYRLVPAMIGEGMVISPTLTSIEDWVALAQGDELQLMALRRPVSVEVVAGSLAGLSYQERVEASFQEIDLLALRMNRVQPSFVSDRHADRVALRNLLSNAELASSSMTVEDYGLDAHAPSELVIGTGDHSKLRVDFGMRPGSKPHAGLSDGVCFFVEARSVSDTPKWDVLMRRCLDGLQTAEPLRPLVTTLSIPQNGTIRLRTDCRQNCQFDWSYWSYIGLFK